MLRQFIWFHSLKTLNSLNFISLNSDAIYQVSLTYLLYFYHTATLVIGYHANIHSIASVDDKHDFIAKEAHNMFSNAGTNIDLEQAKYFIN